MSFLWLVKVGGRRGKAGKGSDIKEWDEPVGADEREEGLCRLLDGLVECLRGGVTVFTEDLVLGEEHALCQVIEVSRTTHIKTRVGINSRMPPISFWGEENNKI